MSRMKLKNEIKIFETIDFKEKTFITGFHGVGGVGYLVSKYLTLQEKSRYVGYITTPRMPMVIRMEGDRIGLPFEIYEYNNFIILLNEAMPDLKFMHRYITKIAEWILENNFKMAILFGGLAERVKGNGEIRIAYTSKYAKEYEKFAPPLEDKLSIIGPLALLLSIFEIHEFPALCILPYARVYEYDLRAALVALKILKEKFDPSIDLTRIEKDIVKERKEELMLLDQFEKARQTQPESKIFYM